MTKHTENASMRYDNERKYLHEKFGKSVKATRYKRGRVNSVWLVVRENEEMIARFYPSFFQEKLPIETWMLCELEKVGAATPRLLEVDTTGFATPVLFLSKLPGRPLTEWTISMEPESVWAILNELRQLIDKVAIIPVKDIGYLHAPARVSSTAGYVTQCMHDYITIIRKFGLLSNEKLAAIENVLRELQTLLVGKTARLTYPDISAGNILIHENHLSGVVDWEFVMGFEPLYGFGNFFLESTVYPGSYPIRAEAILKWLPFEERYLTIRLAILRAVELVSYLPATQLYTSSQKQKRLEAYKQALDELLKLVKSCRK